MRSLIFVYVFLESNYSLEREPCQWLSVLICPHMCMNLHMHSQEILHVRRTPGLPRESAGNGHRGESKNVLPGARPLPLERTTWVLKIGAMILIKAFFTLSLQFLVEENTRPGSLYEPFQQLHEAGGVTPFYR